MSVTKTATRTIKEVLSEANPNEIADALHELGNFGDICGVIDESFTNSPVATTVKLSQKAGAICFVDVESVAGAAGAAGARIVGSSVATPSATVCSLGTDGQTITFEGTVTTVHVRYIPAPTNAVTAVFAATT